MSGLTDEQFEMVCDLAERAATYKLAGQNAINANSLPGLLEDLLAAARRGLETDYKPWDKEWWKYTCGTKTEEDADSKRLIDQLKAGIFAHAAIEDTPGPNEHPQADSFIPKIGDVCDVDGEKVKITHVHTNKIDGQWPSGAWPEVTIVGMRTECPEGETTGGES